MGAESVPAPPVTANPTETPGTPLPAASFTMTTSGFASAKPAGPLWASPETFARETAVAGLPTALNATGERPATVAVTPFAPAVDPSVRVVCAVPAALDVEVFAESEPPPALTANVTVAPATPLPAASVTAT